MKKLNITKEAYNKSKYFTKKYGTLKYVSESGKIFKTSKGQLLKFNESFSDDTPPKPNEEEGERVFDELEHEYAEEVNRAIGILKYIHKKTKKY